MLYLLARRGWVVGGVVAAALVVCSAQAASASQITIGNTLSGESNTFPFGGSYAGLGATEYQQVYEGSLFGGSVSINSVSFYAGLAGGVDADGTYTLSFSTTSAAVNALSTNFATNVGPDSATFFVGALPAYPAVGSPITFALTTPFSFNPLSGNLLLDVTFSGVTNDGLAYYVAQNGDFGSASSRMINGSTGGTTGFGLVTTFATGQQAVPEPISVVLLGTGIAGAVIRRLRRGKAR
jgi:hypothetical protein